jgi:hypothetical protein
MKLFDVVEWNKTAQVATGLTSFQDVLGWNICRGTDSLQSHHTNDGITP